MAVPLVELAHELPVVGDICVATAKQDWRFAVKKATFSYAGRKVSP